MATRSRETFKKRQKELLRIEKQRDKVAKRVARKAAKENGEVVDNDDAVETDELSGPMPDGGDRSEQQVS